MNLRKSFTKIIIFTLILATNNALFGTSILNNSIWNIKYKTVPADQTVSAYQEHLLLPGQMARFAGPPVSIRRSGLGSTVVSSWIDVPVTSDTDDVVIEIGTGWNNSWSFKKTRHVMR
jgi:hypothetical protein